MKNIMTKISIIVPSYNQGRYLEETFQSIIRQQYDNVEVIVMDGGSTDGSVDIIKKYEKYIAYWQSQKDNGQSAAINEGFNRATGEFVTWLNSDDVLLKGALHAVDKTIKANPTINWFLGNLLWMDKYGHIIRSGKVENDRWWWNRHYLLSNGGPTAFMRKTTLQSIGWLREDFHYMMDTELWCRFIANGYPFVRIRQYCWGLRLHEEAKMSGHNFKDSALANKNHPSWIQKQKEHEILTNTYRVSSIISKIWRCMKLFTPSFYTRYTDRRLLDRHYSTI